MAELDERSLDSLPLSLDTDLPVLEARLQPRLLEFEEFVEALAQVVAGNP